LAAAADRAEKAAEQTARELRHEQYGSSDRRQLAGVEPAQRARRCLLANTHAVLEIAPIANGAVPVVSLHLVARFGNDDAAQAVQCGRRAAEETERVAEHSQPPMRGQRRAFRVADARIRIERGCLARDRLVASCIRIDRPRMKQVQLGELARERVRVGQSSCLVLCGEPSDAEGFRYRVANRARAQIAGAG